VTAVTAVEFPLSRESHQVQRELLRLFAGLTGATDGKFRNNYERFKEPTVVLKS